MATLPLTLVEAGLGQYPQYPMLSMNKASRSYEYTQKC